MVFGVLNEILYSKTAHLNYELILRTESRTDSEPLI